MSDELFNGEAYQILAQAYNDYVATFRQSDGTLEKMMALKLAHTHHVVENARLIAEGEKFDVRTARLCEAAALLHDTGRYEQLRRYNTFQDSESVDHAVFSHDIVVEKGWLKACPDRKIILDAVRFHNRREIPAELSDGVARAVARTVRDADKLDIFRVLEDQFEHTDWRHDTRAFWNLAIDASPNPLIVAAIREGSAIDYQHIHSLADFVLIQVGWMISGLEFASSRRLTLERDHLAYRRRFLNEIVHTAVIDELCDLAEKALSRPN